MTLLAAGFSDFSFLLPKRGFALAAGELGAAADGVAPVVAAGAASAFLIASTATPARNSTIFLPISIVFSFGAMAMPLIVALSAATRSSERQVVGLVDSDH